MGEGRTLSSGRSEIHEGASLVIGTDARTSKERRRNPQEQYEIDAAEGREQEKRLEAWAKAEDLWKLMEFYTDNGERRFRVYNLYGFKWSNIDANYMNWSPEEFKKHLNCPKAERQFKNDIEAMLACDTCIIVLPCGRSAHTEAGWFTGKGKRVIAYMPTKQEPELMYKLFDVIACNVTELISLLK